jgi:hypothetical protein
MKTKRCYHLPTDDDRDLPCVQCYTGDDTPTRLLQTRRIALLRPNPLNAAEVNRLIDNLDRALDEYAA